MKYLILLLISLNAMAGLPPTTSRVSGDTSDITTFKYQFPNFTGTHTGTTISLGVNSIAGGGTSATTKAAAFDALSPMTTAGDIIYGGTAGTGTRLAAGTAGQFLKSNGAAAPSWAASNNTSVYAAKTGAYTLTTSDQIVSWDTSGGVGTATLPTAVGNSGLTFIIDLNVAGNALTINTTSAQTIGGIASGTIKLSRVGDSLSVTSDGTNWVINNRTSGASFVPGYYGNIDVFSFSYGTGNATTICNPGASGACSFLDQTGNNITSVQKNSAGNYTMNLSKTYTSLWCTSGQRSAGSILIADPIYCTNASTCTWNTYSTASAVSDSWGTVYCIGKY